MLPLRVTLLPGESLDSWLETLARRNGLSLTPFLRLLQLPTDRPTRHLVTAVPAAVLRTIETRTGAPPGRLDQAVLPAGLPFPGQRDPRCRFCPQCLSERDGRWKLTWWLPWSFACTTHHALLRDACPGCGRSCRTRLPARTDQHPPATCTLAAGGRPVCGTDLRTAAALTLAPDHPLLRTQRWIHQRLTRPDPAAAHTLLGDLNACAGWLMRRVDGEDLRGLGQTVQDAWRRSREAAPTPAGRLVTFDAAVHGVLAHLARPMLEHTDNPADTEGGDPAGQEVLEAAAIGAIRARRGPYDTGTTVIPKGMHATHWAQLSARTRGRFLRAGDPAMSPFERIRLRSPTARAGLPDPGGQQPTDRIRHVPQLLWPGWTVRLMPAHGAEENLFRGIAAALLLLPGEPLRRARGVTDRLHPHLPNAMTVTAARAVRDGYPDVLTTLCNIAEHLDRHGSPIDYTRRRTLVPAAPIGEHAWRQLCFHTGTHPGSQPGDADRAGGHVPRFVHAQRYLHQLLTGSDLTDPTHPLAWRNAGDRSRYLAFVSTLTGAQRRALRSHAENVLADAGITEPLTWEPPADCAAGLTLPGSHPDGLDLQALHRLIVEEHHSPSAAAERLGTTLTHVRFALEHLAREPGHPAPGSPLGAWQLRERVRTVLTPQLLHRHYNDAGASLTRIAAQTGFPRHVVVEHARTLGITIRRGHRPVPIDPAWLRTEYLTRKRSTEAIARDLGTDDETVRLRLHQHGIPLRPAGVHSRTVMTTKIGTPVPADIRAAVEHTLHGWQRLHRFQIVMAFPTLKTAAAYLGAHPNALLRQLQRLELDVGHPLAHRSAGSRPQRPTTRGHTLLRHLRTPAAQALMHAAVPARQRRPMPDAATLADAKTTHTRRQRRGPIKPYKDIPVERIRIRTPTIELLRHILTRTNPDFYGAEIIAATGAASGTLYPQLQRLQQAGWLTSRPEDETAWNRRAPDGRGPGRRRTYYQLTGPGRDAAIHELRHRDQDHQHPAEEGDTTSGRNR